jgi:sarcosine oxidase, subunit gamma
MADDAMAARRGYALDETPHLRQGVSIQVLSEQARFSLRLALAAAEAKEEIAGFRLSMAINRFSANGDRWSARLGPNEWLIGGAAPQAEALAAEVETALAGTIHGLTEVSHRNVALEVAGIEAAATLNAGCPLDLSIRAFPGGSATRTLLGKAEIILIRPGAEPAFRLECWRSFARYVHDFLIEAARDCPPLGDTE